MLLNEYKGIIIGGKRQNIKPAVITFKSGCEGAKPVLQSHEKRNNCCTLAEMW